MTEDSNWGKKANLERREVREILGIGPNRGGLTPFSIVLRARRNKGKEIVGGVGRRPNKVQTDPKFATTGPDLLKRV